MSAWKKLLPDVNWRPVNGTTVEVSALGVLDVHSSDTYASQREPVIAEALQKLLKGGWYRSTLWSSPEQGFIGERRCMFTQSTKKHTSIRTVLRRTILVPYTFPSGRLGTRKVKLTEHMMRLLHWLRENPNKQALDIPPIASLRTAERYMLVRWEGPLPSEGWVLTEEGTALL